MKVILKQNVPGQGKEGDLVEVSDGYARNFLLKKGLAILADTKNMNELKNKIEAKKFKEGEQQKEAKAIAEKINGQTLNLKAKAGTNGRLFGSVTSKEIALKLKENFGVDIDKKKLVLNMEIKSFGCYTVLAKFINGIEANFNVMVVEQN